MAPMNQPNVLSSNRRCQDLRPFQPLSCRHGIVDPVISPKQDGFLEDEGGHLPDFSIGTRAEPLPEGTRGRLSRGGAGGTDAEIGMQTTAEPFERLFRAFQGQLLPSLSRATPSAASEHFSELSGCPISRSLTACCVCLEPRPLPSTGITRLQRYYEPPRHPSASGLSLTGLRLIIPDHALGLPVLRALSLCTCCRHYPGAADGRTPRSNSPIHTSLPRNHYRVGLHIVLFEDC